MQKKPRLNKIQRPNFFQGFARIPITTGIGTRIILISVLRLKERIRIKNVRFCGVQCAAGCISSIPIVYAPHQLTSRIWPNLPQVMERPTC